MPEQATTEFWRNIPAIERSKVFKPDALPEAYIRNAPTDDWTATAGDFVYETPGEGHTLVAYEHSEPMRVFFNVKGPLIWMSRAHYEKVGLGAAAIDKLFR